MHILVIEDERKLANALKDGLEGDGYTVTLAGTGEDGFYLALKQSFDLAIVDVMLPGRNGFEILESLREQRVKIPVLLLTAKDAIADRVLGLDLGADDYLVKPFAFPELLARLRALLRRGSPEQGSRSTIADLEISFAERAVIRDGQSIDLTAKEYEILEYLFVHKGRVVSREMLARDVWKDIARQIPLDNVIDVHLAHLRKKVDDPYSKKLLHTVRGLGFILREENV